MVSNQNMENDKATFKWFFLLKFFFSSFPLNYLMNSWPELDAQLFASFIYQLSCQRWQRCARSPWWPSERCFLFGQITEVKQDGRPELPPSCKTVSFFFFFFRLSLHPLNPLVSIYHSKRYVDTFHETWNQIFDTNDVNLNFWGRHLEWMYVLHFTCCLHWRCADDSASLNLFILSVICSTALLFITQRKGTTLVLWCAIPRFILIAMHFHRNVSNG